MAGKKLKTPFADLLPPLSTEEFAALKADIGGDAKKVRDPVILDEEGNVLDGHHRLKICPKAPTRVVKGLSPAEKEAFVVRANHVRRNLSPAQKTELRKTMQAIAKRLREEDARKWTQANVAAALGVTQQCVDHWFNRDAKAGSKTTRSNTSASSGGNGQPKPDARVKIPPERHPEVAERVGKGESVSQVAADFGATDRQVRTIVGREKKRQEVTAARAKAAKKREGNCGVIVGDFRVGGLGIDDESLDLILTDPPYDEESGALYHDVARFAAEKLAPGGWCVAYSGKAHLPAVMSAFDSHLTYAWTFCVLHTGGDARFRKFKIRTGWKPVVAAYRPPLQVDWDWFRDVVTGGKEKADHPWQQAQAEAAHFIERLCPKGGMVCDPCAGSGTVLLAAKALGRRWIGFEIDEDHAETARSRLDDAAV